jgi:hypothetical protein
VTAPRFRCGDVVRHLPSGETWLVAYYDGRYIAPSGWPACVASSSDCELVAAATDEEHGAAVREWLALPDDVNDDRRRQVERLYSAAKEAKP